MDCRIIVHDRVRQRHPEIDQDDVATAWRNAFAMQSRTYCPPNTYIAAGVDKKGRVLEMVGTELEDESILVYHAMKLTRKMKAELGLL